MTADIVNLNKFRKAKQRAEKDRKAEENRIRHGRSSAEREAEKTQRVLDNAHLDGAKREPARAETPGRDGADENLDTGSEP